MGNLTFIVCAIAYSAIIFLSIVLEALGVSENLIITPTLAIIALAALSFSILNATMSQENYVFGQKPLGEMKTAIWIASHAAVLVLLLSSAMANAIPILAIPIAAIIGMAFNLIIGRKFRHVLSLHTLTAGSDFNLPRLCIHMFMALINLVFAGILAFTIAKFASNLMPQFTQDQALTIVISGAVFMVFWGGMKTQSYAQGVLFVLLLICLGAPFGLMQFSGQWAMPSIQPQIDALANAELMRLALYITVIATIIAVLPSNLSASNTIQKRYKPLKLAGWSFLFLIIFLAASAIALPSLFPATEKFELPEFPGTMTLMAVMAIFLIAISVLASLLLCSANLIGLNLTNNIVSLRVASRKMLTLRLCLLLTGLFVWLGAEYFTTTLDAVFQ